MKYGRWMAPAVLLLASALAGGCGVGRHDPRLPGLDQYDTTKLSRSARRQLRKDTGAPRTKQETFDLGRELFVPGIRELTPLPEFAKAGCDEVRMSRFLGALRTFRFTRSELDAFSAELALPEVVEADYDSDVFRFYYAPADVCGCEEECEAKATAQEFIRGMLGAAPGPESTWLRLFESAIDLDSESWEPVNVLLVNLEGAVHGDAAPGGAIRINLESCRANPRICEITLAHELFHMVQFERGFREEFTTAQPSTSTALGNPGAWFSEGTASWGEQIATGRVVDARKYEEMFTKPGISMWQRSYGFTPAVSFMNTRFVQLPTLGVPGFPGAGVSSLIDLLEAALVSGGSKYANWQRSGPVLDAIGEGYAALFTQMNSVFVGEEDLPVGGLCSDLHWRELRANLKPYVVPLEPPAEASVQSSAEFRHDGSVAAQAARVFRFARAGSGPGEEPMVLNLTLESSSGPGAVSASLLGATFDASTCSTGAECYECPFPVEVRSGNEFEASSPLGCILRMEPGSSALEVRVHLEPGNPALSVAVMGIRDTGYSLSARLARLEPDGER